MQVPQNPQIVRIIPLLVAVCLVTVLTQAEYGGAAARRKTRIRLDSRAHERRRGQGSRLG